MKKKLIISIITIIILISVTFIIYNNIQTNKNFENNHSDLPIQNNKSETQIFEKNISLNSSSDLKGVNKKIIIEGLIFIPMYLEIKKGDSVTWINYDLQSQITSEEGIFDSGNLTKNQNYTYTFNEIGNYSYYNPKYSSIKAKVIVK